MSGKHETATCTCTFASKGFCQPLITFLMKFMCSLKNKKHVHCIDMVSLLCGVGSGVSHAHCYSDELPAVSVEDDAPPPPPPPKKKTHLNSLPLSMGFVQCRVTCVCMFVCVCVCVHVLCVHVCVCVCVCACFVCACVCVCVCVHVLCVHVCIYLPSHSFLDALCHCTPLNLYPEGVDGI